MTQTYCLGVIGDTHTVVSISTSRRNPPTAVGRELLHDLLRSIWEESLPDLIRGPFNCSPFWFDKVAFMFIQSPPHIDKKIYYLLDTSFNEGTHLGLTASYRGSDGWGGVSSMLIRALQSLPVAWKGGVRFDDRVLITCLSDSERLLGFSFSSNPAVKWSWMFSLGVSCPSFTIKFELIALWSFKQMPMRRSVPKVSEIIQRSGMLMSQYARDCDDICSMCEHTHAYELVCAPKRRGDNDTIRWR